MRIRQCSRWFAWFAGVQEQLNGFDHSHAERPFQLEQVAVVAHDELRAGCQSALQILPRLARAWRTRRSMSCSISRVISGISRGQPLSFKLLEHLDGGARFETLKLRADPNESPHIPASTRMGRHFGPFSHMLSLIKAVRQVPAHGEVGSRLLSRANDANLGYVIGTAEALGL
jgi:hypothetical protein